MGEDGEPGNCAISEVVAALSEPSAWFDSTSRFIPNRAWQQASLPESDQARDLFTGIGTLPRRFSTLLGPFELAALHGGILARRVPMLEASSEARVKRALEASESAYWEVDLVTGEVFASSQYRVLYGEPLESLEGWLALGHPDDREVFQRSWESHLTGKTSRMRAERRVSIGKDRWRWLDESAFAFERGEHGTPLRVAGSAVDVTWRKRREERALDDFSFVVSHDLTEPVRTIRSFVQLVMESEQDLSDESDRYLHFAYDASVRMSQLIEDLLRYTRIGAPAPPEVVDPSAAARDAVVDLTSVLDESEATVTIDDIPPCLINSVRLRQVFNNLFTNAIRFRRPGEPQRITVTGKRDRKIVRIFVTDEGVGIPKHQRERVFRVFQRLNRDGKSGSGIGLSIVKRIIEQASGTIWLDDNPDGPGTRVVVQLPAAV